VIPGAAVALLALAGPVVAQAPAAGSAFRDCEQCPPMVRIPPGSFVIGSPDTEADREANEGPQRTVTIAKPFALGQFEVTVGEYAAFIAASGHRSSAACPNVVAQRAGSKEAPSGTWRSHSFAQADNHPLACVSRADADAYIAWLSTRAGVRYRLLSEAEWEYAARAGAPNLAAVGTRGETLCARGNVADRALNRDVPAWPAPFADCDDGVGHGTAPVGAYAPNAFGLHDMVGNVWGYTEDCYAESYAATPADGSAYIVPNCPRRTVRGGGLGPFKNEIRWAPAEPRMFGIRAGDNF
jgi:formylglycine-generating enzyme required for sulfatase activity